MSTTRDSIGEPTATRLPPRAADSAIVAREDGDEVHLQWEIPPNRWNHALALGFMAFFGVWIAAALGIMDRLPAFPKTPINVMAPLMVVVGGALGACYLWWLIRPTLPESLTITDDVIIHNTGRHPARPLERQRLIPFFRQLTNAGVSTEYTRREIRHFLLSHEDGQQRLTFRNREHCIEIGASLSEPDRTWLFLLLEKWRTYAPPTADSA